MNTGNQSLITCWGACDGKGPRVLNATCIQFTLNTRVMGGKSPVVAWIRGDVLT